LVKLNNANLNCKKKYSPILPSAPGGGGAPLGHAGGGGNDDDDLYS
jgi:hypothetical protein